MDAALATCLASWRDEANDVLALARRLADGEASTPQREFALGAALIALVARFQRACRNLLATAAGLIGAQLPDRLAPLVAGSLLLDLRISRGNPTASAIAADLKRFEIDLTAALEAHASEPALLRTDLEAIISLRNAQAHGDASDLDPPHPDDLADYARTLDAIASAMAQALDRRAAALHAFDAEE